MVTAEHTNVYSRPILSDFSHEGSHGDQWEIFLQNQESCRGVGSSARSDLVLDLSVRSERQSQGPHRGPHIDFSLA